MGQNRQWRRRLADSWAPKFITVSLRAGDTDGSVQVKVSDQPNAFVDSIPGFQVAVPQITSVNVQQGVQGLRLIWGKETMIQVKAKMPTGCTGYIDEATFTWKRNGEWITPAVGGMKKPGSGGVKISDTTTIGFSEDADITMTGGWYMPGLFPLSEFGGAWVYLRRGRRQRHHLRHPGKHIRLPGYRQRPEGDDHRGASA